MSGVREWLDGLGLGDYAAAFEAERVTLDALPHLTEANLKELGLPMGPRAQVLSAAKDGVAVVAPPAESGQREAERRQITVMFCDLVGSTALSEKLDPEDLREVMRAYQDACAGAIKRYDGHIAQTLGDGLMVYFGYPLAHEDAPQRAVRAGLDIVAAVAELSVRLDAEQSVTVSVRIGIHTGLVVAGEVGGADTRGDMAVVGETPNIAARIESLAEPDTVVVGDRTRRLIGDVFDFDDLGSHALKGLSLPMALYQATAERAADSRFEAMHPAGVTPFVGRDEEIGLLLGRWAAAKSGEGQVVLLEGEPGIGKSRITDTVREMIGRDDHRRLQFQCSPFYTNSALYPFIIQLERAARSESEDSPDIRLDKLEALIGADDAETLALIGSLLSLPLERYPPLAMSPQKQKERTIEVLVEQIARLARQAVILLVFEDVHWIDPTSLEALDQVIAAIAAAPVLVIVTFRPEFTPQWGAHSHVTLHSLNRLGKRQSGQLVERVTGGKPLPEQLHDQIISKTDGVPLFIEELTKAVIESDIVSDEGDRYAISGAVDSLAIPDTLHDSLMARLDKLIPVKEVAQVGAAIGREFSHQLIAAVSPMSKADLDTALDKLVASQLVYRRGTPPQASYTFKHALVQDAAYDSLLKRDRQDLHKEIAEALLAYFPTMAETEPELLAHHLTVADLAERAVPYWLSAGRTAVGRSAFADALAHLRKGLDLLGALAPSDDRDRQELHFQALLMPVHITLTGWGSLDLAQAAGRAKELAEKFNEIEMLNGIWHILWMVLCASARYPEALEVANQAVKAGEDGDVSAFRVVGHFSAACTHGWLGEFAKSQDEMRAVVADYDFDQHKDIVWSTNHDPLNSILSYWCHFYWITGYPDQAMRTALEQIDMARRLNHPFNTIWALACGGCAFIYRNEPEPFSEWITEATAIAEDQALSFALEFISAFSGMGLIWSGRYEEGYRKVARCVDMFTAAGIGLMVPMYQTNMSDALGQMDRTDEGLELIERAIDLTNETGERFYAAETYRIKGELLLGKSRDRDAEEAFQDSLRIAADQKAKGWELRTAMSLARLWRRQNKSSEAHDLLSPVHDWFTEGFDTADLKAAKALLQELA